MDEGVTHRSISHYVVFKILIAQTRHVKLDKSYVSISLIKIWIVNFVSNVNTSTCVFNIFFPNFTANC